MRSFDGLKNRAEIVKNGWEMAGISDVLGRKGEIRGRTPCLHELIKPTGLVRREEPNLSESSLAGGL